MVEEGEDWKNVEIPASSDNVGEEASEEISSSSAPSQNRVVEELYA